ncbi:helix-turn-helix domain-containing protein [Brucella tritici]|uniref:Helix-turn-helix domain-containing protein n=1 Tax=Brucella tritici TaxID=94626 RepID=A0A7V7VQM5_9HYPH|nr:recombinase family protein [Brucella tritici]KAB2655107.1 helix-turn-helix domain-containing protein [Brucella tritici]
MIYGYAKRSISDTDAGFQDQVRVVTDQVKQYLFSRHFSMSESDASSRVVEELVSTAQKTRPKLVALVNRMEIGSTLIITSPDMVAGNVRGFLDFVHELNKRDATLIVARPNIFVNAKDALVDPITFDPNEASLVSPLKIVKMLAAMESALDEEKDREIKSAKVGANKGGRKSALTDDQIARFKEMQAEGYNQLSIAKTLGVSQSTISRYNSDLITKVGRAKNAAYKEDPSERRAKRRIYEATYRARKRAQRNAEKSSDSETGGGES